MGSNTDATWVGLKDQTGDDTDASHIWLKSGYSVAHYSYSNWCISVPTNCPKAPAHYCVQYIMPNPMLLPNVWVWADVPCSFPLKYICEIGE